MTSQLPIRKPGGEIVAPVDAVVAAIKVHAAESKERAAIRSKDVEHLESAVREKLEAQRVMALEYRSEFSAGGDRGKNQYAEWQVDSADHLAADAYCQSLGFNARTVRRWVERLTDAARFEIEFVERFAKVLHIVEMEQAANFSSESFEWYTPARYIETVRATLGEIDLDPASSEQANQVVQAGAIFTAADQALTRDWFGRVFTNPPYGKTEDGGSLAAAFCNKAIAEYQIGRVSECIILVNSLHSQAWQRPLYDHVVCLVDHRIQFASSDGEENKSPTFQNAFFYLGENASAFAQNFAPLGYVMAKFP